MRATHAVPAGPALSTFRCRGTAALARATYISARLAIYSFLLQPRESTPTPLTDSAFHPEDIARAAIDRSLGACGWVVQSRSAMNVGRGARRRRARIPDRFWAGRLRAVRRSPALRRHRSKAGRHDAVGFLRAGRTLHGGCAGLSRFARRDRSGSNMSRRRAKSCFATTPIPRRSRAASSPSIARRRSRAG